MPIGSPPAAPPGRGAGRARGRARRGGGWARARWGRNFYLVQLDESLSHGEPARVDETYRLPLRKIVISTWLAGIMRERFASDAPVLVTPVGAAPFHPVPPEGDDGFLRVLMLHHDYDWKGVPEGLDAYSRVNARHAELRLGGLGVQP